jgi:hypothetical protein
MTQAVSLFTSSGDCFYHWDISLSISHPLITLQINSKAANQAATNQPLSKIKSEYQVLEFE